MLKTLLKKNKKKTKNIFVSLKKGSTFALPIHDNITD